MANERDLLSTEIVNRGIESSGPNAGSPTFSIRVRRRLPDFLQSVNLKYVKLGYHYLINHAIYLATIPVLVLVFSAEVGSLSKEELWKKLWEDTRYDLATVLGFFGIFVFALSVYFMSRPRSIYLVDFASFRPKDDFKVTKAEFIELARKSGKFDEASLEFQTRILHSSGIGDETYVPRSVIASGANTATMKEGRAEASAVMFGALDELFEKTRRRPKDVGILVVNCSIFNPTPSLSAMIINHYKMRGNILSYNLGGMGCSAGVIAVELARDMLQANPNNYAVVVSTEMVGYNWYSGKDRSMLIPNCFFRMGCSAVLLSNRRRDYRRAKYRLEHIVRTHKGADDRSFRCVYQEEDEQGLKGLKVSKDIVEIGGDALKTNITTLGPLVLPLSEQLGLPIQPTPFRIFSSSFLPYPKNFPEKIKRKKPETSLTLMDATTPVNWEALDALVIDFAKSENLIEDSFASSSSPSSVHSSPSSSSSPSLSSSSYHSRLIIRQIRRSLESGDVDAAIDILRAHAPFILDDHRLLFRLHKQKFIELLRRGTLEDRDSAINCLRTSLAPCALDAYPEAYEEFKHVLLAFIYDKADQSSPVANEWSERRRFDIAGLLSTVLRAHLHAYDPVFSMTLRYLISIHKGFCFRQGISSPISDLPERLLLEERDPPATPQETLYEAPPFDEVDIQALAHAVELTRQGAVDSLRFAKGDLFQAFQNELCRMNLDVSMLDELVREYCVYRGIVDSVFASPSGIQTLSKQLKVDHPVLGSSSSRDLSLEVDCGASKNSDADSSISNAHVGGSPEKNVDVTSMQGIDVELRYAIMPTTIHEDCSTSGSHQPENLRIQQRSRISAGERSKRKRWRGRNDDVGFTTTTSVDESSKQDLSTSNTERQVLDRHSILDIKNREDRYEIILGMKELASRGMAAEVVEEVNALDPSFFVQNPIFLFQLKQVEFLKLVSSGDYSGGLRVACSHLGPLAASDPSLLKPLKETLLALLQPNEEAVGKGLPLHALASSLQVAIGKRLGIEEPQLMKIIRTTLNSHNEWFKLQMCKDRFESLLQIDSLKEANPSLLTSITTSKMNTDRSSNGSPQATLSSSSRMSEDGSSPTQASSRDVICDENAILKVMEFLALPRADAIHLLAQYNGNAETVIQQIFA